MGLMYKRSAFTLVELLVVIGIIALLISILLPSLGKARASATSVKSQSNLRQIGIALEAYRVENRGQLPVAAYASLPDRARWRWADSLYTFMKSTDIFLSPNLNDEELGRLRRPFFHTTAQTANPGILPSTIYFGGYGYNWQYLGNGRELPGIPPFFLPRSGVRVADRTIAVADTNGTRNGGTQWTSEGAYVVDPPLQSLDLGSRGSRKSAGSPGPGNFGYSGGNDGDDSHRATPWPRNRGKVAVLWLDGHSTLELPRTLDDSNNDGLPDNGYWNGLYDITRR
jgi:prepilin-type N-terminal cleavage/methylation domain-containing protein